MTCCDLSFEQIMCRKYPTIDFLGHVVLTNFRGLTASAIDIDMSPSGRPEFTVQSVRKYAYVCHCLLVYSSPFCSYDAKTTSVEGGVPSEPKKNEIRAVEIEWLSNVARCQENVNLSL